MAKLQKGVNDLESWCLNNGEFGQKLMAEWTGICDDGRRYSIIEVARASSKKFKWKCSKGHDWSAAIRDRTAYKTGCPQCYKKVLSKRTTDVKIPSENSLDTWCSSQGDYGIQLRQEWTGIRDGGRCYQIDAVTRASGKRFKWHCQAGHEWYATVSDRTSHKSGCPQCAKEVHGARVAKARLSDRNSLETWCSSNGAFGQQLKSEWTGICEDGNTYKIDEASYGSSCKKFKWHCQAGHEWYAKVNDRTSQKTGCPYCNNIGSSYPEQFIYHSLKQIYPNAENRCKVLRSPQNPKGVEFDIGISEIPLCIEYSPTCWHEGKEERDQYKKDLCEQCGVRLIQIVEDSYNELEHTTSDNYICFKMDENKKDEILTKIVDHILKSLGHSISEIDLEKVKKNAWDYSKGKIEYEKSLAGVYSELAKEWHPTLNNNLKPDEIKCGSSKKVYWQCPNCNHGENGEWQVVVNSRTYQKSGCPKCGHNWYKT